MAKRKAKKNPRKTKDERARELSGWSKEQLRSKVKQLYRVVDVRGAGKATLAGMILHAEGYYPREKNPAMKAKKRPLSMAAKRARSKKVAKAFGYNKARYKRTRVASVKEFDRRSFRTIDPGKPGGHKMIVGCPIGKWDAKRKRCKVGMEVQSVLTEKSPRKSKNPLLMIVPNANLKAMSDKELIRLLRKVKNHAHEVMGGAFDMPTLNVVLPQHYKALKRITAEALRRGIRSVRANPLLMVVPNKGKKAICGNMIQITLHRGSYPTLIAEDAARAIRAGRRGTMRPSDYKYILQSTEWHNLGRGKGYSSGFSFLSTQTGAELVETFDSSLGAFVLRRKVAKTAKNWAGRHHKVAEARAKKQAAAYRRKAAKPGLDLEHRKALKRLAILAEGRAQAHGDAWELHPIWGSAEKPPRLKEAKNPPKGWHAAQRKRYAKRMADDLKAKHGGGADYWQGATSAESRALAKHGVNSPRLRKLMAIVKRKKAGYVDRAKVSVPLAGAILKVYAQLDASGKRAFAKAPIDRMVGVVDKLHGRGVIK